MSDGPVKRYPRNTRYALLLALGEFSLAEIPESRRQALLEQLGTYIGSKKRCQEPLLTAGGVFW